MNYPIDISNTILKTSRLTLRPFKEDDLDDFYYYCSNEDVGIHAGWPPHKNKGESKVILNTFILNKKVFAICLNDKVIGSLGIEEYDEKDLNEFKDLKGRMLGYVLSKDYWGQGLMLEAVKEVIRYLFEDVKLDFIACGHFDYNIRSQRVIEKCGFKYYKDSIYEAKLINKVFIEKLYILSKENLK